MGWLIDNMNALDRYQTTADNRERQIREDAYTDEQRQRKRMEQEQKDAADKTTSEEMANMMRDMGTTPVDARDVLGVKPAQAAPANNPSAYVAPQAPAAAPANTYADAARKNLTSSMRIAAANKDYTGFQAAYNGFQKLKMNEDSALIASYIQNAPDEELQQVMTKVTLDPQNKYDAVYDPKSGFTTIKLGDTAAQLDRVQLGKYFAAKHRLVQGDYAALNDIGAISGELAKKVADELQLTDRMADTNNVVNNHKRTLANADRSAARANKAHDPLQKLNDAKTLFKAVHGRDPSREEVIKLAGMGEEDLSKADRKTADAWVTEGIKSGTITVADAPDAVISAQRKLEQARRPAPLPSGLVVGASSKQADGVYNAQGRQVTIQNGKVTEIK